MTKLDRLKEKTFYEILNVEKTATVEQIKVSYKEIARIYHPDSNFFSEIIAVPIDPEDEEVFKYITSAYTVLINLEDRKKYDRSLPPDLPDWDSNEAEPISTSGSAGLYATPAPANPQAFETQIQRLQRIASEAKLRQMEQEKGSAPLLKVRPARSHWQVVGLIGGLVIMLFVLSIFILAYLFRR